MVVKYLFQGYTKCTQGESNPGLPDLPTSTRSRILVREIGENTRIRAFPVQYAFFVMSVSFFFLIVEIAEDEIADVFLSRSKLKELTPRSRWMRMRSKPGGQACEAFICWQRSIQRGSSRLTERGRLLLIRLGLMLDRFIWIVACQSQFQTV